MIIWNGERTIGTALEVSQDKAEGDMPYSDSEPPRLRNTVAGWMRTGGELKEPVSSVFSVLPLPASLPVKSGW